MKRCVLSIVLAHVTREVGSVDWSPKEESIRWKPVEADIDRLRRHIEAIMPAEWMGMAKVVARKSYDEISDVIASGLWVLAPDECAAVTANDLDEFAERVRHLFGTGAAAVQRLSEWHNPDRASFASESGGEDWHVSVAEETIPVAEILRAMASRVPDGGSGGIVFAAESREFLLPRISPAKPHVSDEEVVGNAYVLGVIDDECRAKMRFDRRKIWLRYAPSDRVPLLNAQSRNERVRVRWHRTVQWVRGAEKNVGGVVAEVTTVQPTLDFPEP